MVYSFIINKERKLDSTLFIIHNNKYIKFSDVQYQSDKETVSSKGSFRYPSNMQINAKNDDCQVSVRIQDNSEIKVNELINNIDFIGRLYAAVYRKLSGNPKGLKLLAKADVVIENSANRTEIDGVCSISEYIRFA
jgi:hypothetical protein